VEAEELVREFEKSGLSRKTFSAERGFSVHNDAYGSPVTVKYPDFDNGDGTTVLNHTVIYGYDDQGRVSSYYSAAYAVNGIGSQSVWETRSYNMLNQLTGISLPNYSVNLTYSYPAGGNNGQISGMADGTTGLTVTYAYDSLKRLSSASATGPSSWSQSYVYDGFGNLYQKNGTTMWNGNVDPATNRMTGVCYDNNGNMEGGCNVSVPGSQQYVYDIQNRLASGPGIGNSVYLYSAANKRIAKLDSSGNETVYFYGVHGEKLTTFTLFSSQTAAQVMNNVYFAGRLVERYNNAFGRNAYVFADRLGSVGNGASTFLPYGEELATPQTPNDVEKFATYTRDSTSGLDYADQRFYNSTYGRFMSPDPYKASGGPGNPTSWNRYAYVESDPVNHRDSTGQLIDPDHCCPAKLFRTVPNYF
jgi:RHS repeat-associated protein